MYDTFCFLKNNSVLIKSKKVLNSLPQKHKNGNFGKCEENFFRCQESLLKLDSGGTCPVDAIFKCPTGKLHIALKHPIGLQEFCSAL